MKQNYTIFINKVLSEFKIDQSDGVKNYSNFIKVINNHKDSIPLVDTKSRAILFLDEEIVALRNKSMNSRLIFQQSKNFETMNTMCNLAKQLSDLYANKKTIITISLQIKF